MLQGPKVASMPAPWARAYTPAAAFGSSGFTPHHAHVSTVLGGGGTTAWAGVVGPTTTAPSARATTSATEHGSRLVIRRSLGSPLERWHRGHASARGVRSRPGSAACRWPAPNHWWHAPL